MLRSALVRHRELLRFGAVGAIAFAVTAAVNYALKLSVLAAKPVTALAVATVVATGVSYVLSRTWSFRERGGRRRHHEAVLFGTVNAVAVVINVAPAFVSRYVLNLRVPLVSLTAQEIADFTAGMVVGTVLATGFRWWGYRRWVFPASAARRSPGGTSSRLSTLPVALRGSSWVNSTSRGMQNRGIR
ncbi:putative flippase GtrA [Prauserella shujinwangii]|uniref:Putative flippase GtrA n=1 Tax=Prauserella shujinwangii TaxID=1453103 RepID=A0A2T0LL36_9PSEU|nr:putative flippase GtrA [Prauserella shujinwangii]